MRYWFALLAVVVTAGFMIGCSGDSGGSPVGSGSGQSVLTMNGAAR